MEITTEKRGPITVVAIAGSVDGMTAAALISSFRAEVSGGNIRIVGAFAQVEYPSSAGPRVAVVLGSGSVKCAAALGLLRVLKREGIGVDMIVGCSGGSVYAALIAMGHDVDTAEAMTRRLWTRELTARRNHRSLLSVFL